MKILGLIIARGENTGFPRKHLQNLGGKPVVAHVIEYAVNESAIDMVALSTDSPEILGLAHEADIISIKRPDELSTADVPVTGALVHALEYMKEHYAQEFDAIAVLYGCVPFRPDDVLVNAVNILKTTNATAVRTYCPVWKFYPQFMVTIQDDKVRPFVDINTIRRQEILPLFLPDGAVILVRTSVVMAAASDKGYAPNYMGNDIRGIVCDFPSAIEIDEPFDLKFCEMVMNGCF